MNCAKCKLEIKGADCHPCRLKWLKENRPKGFADKDKPTGTCVRCPNPLPPNSKLYCSGACLLQAKEDGTYVLQ
jgi:hypothetical protein